MTNSAPVTHGMASSIRSATESEVFDLGGLGPDTIENIVVDALSQPFSSSREEMIRITLVVGAGKQSRQKYHAQAMKVVTSTLQNKCGFVEDRGASCVMECQGMYKVQHDTGKNLKTVVLFPKMEASSSSKGGKNISSAYSGDRSEPSDAIFPVNSMEYKAAASSLSVFQNMIKAKCATWSQKKAALQLIEQQFVEQIIEPVEDLLMRGQVVPSDLQHYYDHVLVEISEKQQFVKQAMHGQVETGNLTEYELDYLLEQVDQRIKTLSKGGGGNPAALTKAKERRDMLKSFTPVSIPKLQHHAALGKLWKQVYALNIPLDLDGNSSGRLLSVQESRLVAKRDDLLQEIEQLEYASQGWLEDDEIFEWRVQECRNEFVERFAASSKRKAKSGSSYASMTSGANRSSSSRKPITNWITPMDKKGPAVAKKKTKMKKQDLFSAMMAASSSEEEDSDDDGDGGNAQDRGAWQQVDKNQGARQAVPQKSSGKANQKPQSQSNTPKESSQVAESTQQQTDSSAGGSKNKKRNKKKKKGKNSNESGENATSAQKSESQSATVSQGIPQAILQVLMAVLHLIMAILTWFVSLLFGSKSKKRGKKKKN